MRRTFWIAAVLGCAVTAQAADKPRDLPDPGDFSKCEARYATIGLPVMKSDGSDDGPIALCNAAYAVALNPDTRVPDWVIEKITAAMLKGNAMRKNNFHPDTRAKDAGSTLADYKGSGGKKAKYDRGHQAPAADFKFNQDRTNESFLMTNMAPQTGPGFNQSSWKALETDIRLWVACGETSQVYVITGPVYGDDDEWIPRGKDRVRVPAKFFKVIYDPDNNRALGMLMPNHTKIPTKDVPKYTKAIADIEDETGIVFFPALSKREQNVLKSSAGNLWGHDDSCKADVDE